MLLTHNLWQLYLLVQPPAQNVRHICGSTTTWRKQGARREGRRESVARVVCVCRLCASPPSEQASLEPRCPASLNTAVKVTELPQIKLKQWIKNSHGTIAICQANSYILLSKYSFRNIERLLKAFPCSISTQTKSNWFLIRLAGSVLCKNQLCNGTRTKHPILGLFGTNKTKRCCIFHTTLIWVQSLLRCLSFHPHSLRPARRFPLEDTTYSQWQTVHHRRAFECRWKDAQKAPDMRHARFNEFYRNGTNVRAV